MDSSPVLSREQRLGTRESELLTRWESIDGFLEIVGELVDAALRSGVDPPMSFGWVPAVLIVETMDDLLRWETKEVSRQGLWFLIMAYLDARREPRRWYDVSDDDASCLQWLFFQNGERGDEDLLSPKELVVLHLRARSGMAPDWFQPMPEA